MEVIKKSDKTKYLDLVNQNQWDSEQYLRTSNYFDEWKAWNDQYRSIPDKKPYNWMSNNFVPMTQSKVEAAVSNLIGVLLSMNPPFQIKPKESGDVDQARIMQCLLQYQLEESGFYKVFQEFLRSICIYGTAVGKVVWDTKFQSVTEWTPKTEPILSIFGMQLGQRFLGNFPEVKEKKIYGYPRFIPCNLIDIFPDPASIDVQDGWIIHRTFRSKDYLLKMHEAYPDIYTKEVLLIEESDTTEKKEADGETYSSIGRDSEPLVKREPNEGKIELFERWGLAEQKVDGKTELVPSCITVANGKYLIRNTANPFWHQLNPFVKGTYIPAENSFYGIGIPEILEGLQNNLNEIFNQRNDNISFALNKPVTIKKGAGINAKKMTLKPGGVFTTDEDIDSSIRFMDIADYTGNSFRHLADIERWSQEASGVTNLTMGIADPSQNDTASGMAMLQRASGERFMGIARNLENTVFKEILKFYYQLDYQFLEEDEEVRIVGEYGQGWTKVSPEVVRRNYDIIPAGVFTSENKGQKSLRLIQFLNIMKGNPLLKETELLKKIYSSLDIGDTPDELIRTDGEIGEIQRLAEQMALQMVSQALGQPIPGEKSPKTPGMGGSQNMVGGEIAGTPGVPPVAPAIPPQDRV
jgi:hypothetical protein